MKRTLYILIALLAIQACNTQTSQPEIINEVYEPTDEELYEACAELQGIGQFVIGKTTFKQVLNDKEFKAATFESDRESNLYNGHWGIDFWKSKSGSVSTQLDKAHWMKQASKGKVKQLYCSGSGKKFANLEFDKFDMAFLNDTLVAIWFYPKREIVKDVIGHYKDKYGNGRGHYKYLHTRYKRGDKYYGTTDTDEVRTWDNGKVVLEYVNRDYFKSEPNVEAKSYFNHTLLISSKNRYPVFVETLNGLAEQFDNEQKETKKDALNAL